MLVKEARALLRPADGNYKMNCGTWGLSTDTCGKCFPTREDSVCHPDNCYAQHNLYLLPNVRPAQDARLDSIDNPDFILAMSTILNRQKYFRFFDSGDFPNTDAMRRILRACQLAPFTKIHIPTKRYRWLNWYKGIWPVPQNVVLRASMWKIDPTQVEVEVMLVKFSHIAVVSKFAFDKVYLDLEGNPIHVCPAVSSNPDGRKQCILDCTHCFEQAGKAVIFQWHR